MFPIAGQTAGPIGLKLFVDTHGWPGGDKAKKIQKKFFSNFFFHGQRRALQLVVLYTGLSTKGQDCKADLKI